MGFRKSPANVKGIEGRESVMIEARKFLDDGASFLQSLQVFGVVELKRRVSYHSDYHRLGRLPGPSGRRLRKQLPQRFCRFRNIPERSKVHMVIHLFRGKGQRFRKALGLLRRHKSQMTFRKEIVLLPRDDSQYGNPAIVLDCSPQNRFMAFSGDLIEKHPGDSDLGVELETSQDLRRCRACDFGCIHDENDRCPEEFGQFRSGKTAPDIDPVIQTAIAFYQTAITSMRALNEGAEHLFSRHQKRVQIVTGLLGCHGQPACIDIIRPFLKRDQPQPLVSAPCRHKAKGYQGLASTTTQCCNHQTRFNDMGISVAWGVARHSRATTPRSKG